jgi:hypothetical protein
MLRWFRPILFSCALLPACEGAPVEPAVSPASADEFAAVEVEDREGKFDLPGYPTPMGLLLPERAYEGELAGLWSGYHLYRFEGRAGTMVRFLLESPDFETYLRVTGPGGKSQTWAQKGDVLHPIDHVYFSVIDVELPSTGTYKVLVSSAGNMGWFPVPHTDGAYTLTTETDL